MNVFGKIVPGSAKTGKNGILLFMAFLFIIPNKVHSQTDSTDIYNLNLLQLSSIKIISASKASQRINEVPSTVFVIDKTMIKENGYFTLEEALSDLPGFQFRNILGINSYVFQRGVPSQNNLTLLLIDGIQINELNSGGFYAGGQYNLSNIERIEVIYGPSSVVYGTNAVSGIINLVTKSVSDKKIEIGTLAGNYKTLKSDATISHFNNKKESGFVASGMIKTTGKANLKGSEGDNNWTDLMENFENDYSFDLKIRIKDFNIGTNILYKQASTATLNKSVGTDYRDYGSSWNIRFINLYLKYNKKLSEKLSVTSILYNRNATVLRNTVYYVVDTAQIGYYRPNNLTGFENIMNFDLTPYFSFTSGLTIEFEQLSEKNSLSFSDSPEHRPPKPQKPAMVNNNLVSLFLEPRLTIFKNLYLSGGFRLDQSTIYSHVLTPRASFIYQLNNHLFRFSYAEAFRAPKPWDYSDGLGNTSLLPEKLKSIEAAFVFSISKDIRIDLIGYKNNLENALIKEFLNEDYKWTNGGKINTGGIEIFFRFAFPKIKSSLNYTYSQSYDERKEFIPEISRHTGNAGITYSFNKYIKLNLRANYTGKRKNPKTITATDSQYIEPFWVFHGALSFINQNGFNCQLLAKNIFNKEYYHTSNRDPDRYRQPQRTLMLSFSYEMRQ